MSGQADASRLNLGIQLAAVADFSLGGLWVQPSSRRVSDGGREELVEPRVMQVLIALAEADGAVVSRDALIERCWGGRIVGEDAINRCIGKVRRLAEIAEPAGFAIETVPKVGYRLKLLRAPMRESAGVEAADGGPVEGFAEAPQGAAAVPAAPFARAGRALRLAGVAIGGAAVAGALAWAMVWRPAPPADRMTLRILPFAASGEPGAAGLAGAFTQAAVERLSQNELLVVSTAAPQGQAGSVAARYSLLGSVRVEASTAKIAVQVVERPTGRLLYTVQSQEPAGIGQQAVYGAAVRLLAGVARHIRDAEFARYSGQPRDVQDMVLRASVAVDGWGAAHDAAALALGERALAAAPNNLSAQAVMAALLYCDFLDSAAGRGDAEGQRALGLIENVLDQHPRNLTDRHLYVVLLAALGDLRGAQSAAEAALADETENPGLRWSLSSILLQQGDVAGSMRALPQGTGVDDAFPAMQAFAQGRYDDALTTMQRVDAVAPPDGMSMLFSAATLVRVGQMAAARGMVAKAMPTLPPELRQVSALRQVLFSLPDASWSIFKQSLRMAGMPG